MSISVKVIGTDPPCPRCHRTFVVGTKEAERYGRCVSLRQFAELVGEPMPDISEELDRKAKPLLERHPDSGLILSPAVVINDRLKFFGQVPDKGELREALREAMNEGGDAD